MTALVAREARAEYAECDAAEQISQSTLGAGGAVTLGLARAGEKREKTVSVLPVLRPSGGGRAGSVGLVAAMSFRAVSSRSIPRGSEGPTGFPSA